MDFSLLELERRFAEGDWSIYARLVRVREALAPRAFVIDARARAGHGHGWRVARAARRLLRRPNWIIYISHWQGSGARDWTPPSRNWTSELVCSHGERVQRDKIRRFWNGVNAASHITSCRVCVEITGALAVFHDGGHSIHVRT